MSFDDKDLARLKMFLANYPDNEMFMPFDGSPMEKTKALVERLDAAEELAKAKEHPLHAFLTSTGDTCPIATAEAKWIQSKSAGKPQGEGGR